jgi:hypothetical protein
VMTRGSDDNASNKRRHVVSSRVAITCVCCVIGRVQILYIQMEYCPNRSLRDAIDEVCDVCIAV